MKLISVNYESSKQLFPVASTNQEGILSQYSDVFDDKVLEEVPGVVHLHVKDCRSQAQMPARRIPVSLKLQVKEELSDLVKKRVL